MPYINQPYTPSSLLNEFLVDPRPMGYPTEGSGIKPRLDSINKKQFPNIIPITVDGLIDWLAGNDRLYQIEAKGNDTGQSTQLRNLCKAALELTKRTDATLIDFGHPKYNGMLLFLTAMNVIVQSDQDALIGIDNFSQSVSGVTTGTYLQGAFKVAGNHEATIKSGDSVWVTGSTGNDRNYTVGADSTFASPDTTIQVREPVIDATADGAVKVHGSSIRIISRAEELYGIGRVITNEDYWGAKQAGGG